MCVRVCLCVLCQIHNTSSISRAELHGHSLTPGVLNITFTYSVLHYTCNTLRLQCVHKLMHERIVNIEIKLQRHL